MPTHIVMSTQLVCIVQLAISMYKGFKGKTLENSLNLFDCGSAHRSIKCNF